MLLFRAGLRSEFTLSESFQPKIDSLHTFNYLRFFPSLFASCDLGKGQAVLASYSKRIRRPRGGSMVPFLVVQDPNSYLSGNPYLRPESTDNFEINFSKNWTVVTLNAGVFYRYTTDGLARRVRPWGEATLVTSENADTRHSSGSELVRGLNFSRNFSTRLTGNVYYSAVSARTGEETYSNGRTSWTLNLLANYNMPQLFCTQATVFYQGPIVVPQGEFLPVFGLNLGFRRNVLKQQGTLSLNVSDVLNTRRFALKTTDRTFNLKREFRFDSRVITFAFTYRFL